MKPIPPQHHDKYLMYLNDFIQASEEYKSVCAERAVKAVFLEVIGGTDYTIIDFKDTCSLIIAGVYAQFEVTIMEPPPGAA
jgi:hypothetical protein